GAWRALPAGAGPPDPRTAALGSRGCRRPATAMRVFDGAPVCCQLAVPARAILTATAPAREPARNVSALRPPRAPTARAPTAALPSSPRRPTVPAARAPRAIAAPAPVGVSSPAAAPAAAVSRLVYSRSDRPVVRTAAVLPAVWL